MAVTHLPVMVQTPETASATWTNADSADTKKTVATAGTNGAKITAIVATSSDTSDRVAQLWITRSAVSYLLASVNIPDLSGFNGTDVTVDLKNSTSLPGLPVDNDGQTYLFLESGDTLQVSFTTQVTAAKTVYVTTFFANF